MTNAVDDAKTELKAALLNLLESGVSLNKIRMAPLCSQFQLSFGKDKAATLFEEILKESGVEPFLMDYLKRKLDEEVIAEMEGRKQELPERKPRRKAEAPKKEPSEKKAPMSHSRDEQKLPTEAAQPRELFVVGEKGSLRGASGPASPDMKPRMSRPDRRPANLQSITPGSTLSRGNDNGASLDEAMEEMTDAFHVIATGEPSLADVKAVTRYLRSVTKLAQARAAS